MSMKERYNTREITCPNCDEELYIYENQYEDLPHDLSVGFSIKIKEGRNHQAKRIKNHDLRG